MVLCPTENKNDVEKILRDEYSPCNEDFTIKMVSDIWEVIELLLVENELKP
jgi:predicted ATP-dependent protease